MGKSSVCIVENKSADQLHSNCKADQRLCFHFTDSTIALLIKSEISTFFCDCTALFVLDLIGNQIVVFLMHRLIYFKKDYIQVLLAFEPVHDKTSNLGFRPCPTQTGLYSHRRWLEAGNFGFIK